MNIPNSNIFGKHFGIPIKQKYQTWLSRPQTKNEPLVTYSFPPDLCCHPFLIYDSDTTIYQILPCCLHFESWYVFIDILHQLSSISEKYIYINHEQVAVAQFYHLTNDSPTQTIYWETAYQLEPTTDPLLDIIRVHGSNTIKTSSTESIKNPYKELIIIDSLHIISKHMVYLKYIPEITKFLSLIVVSEIPINKLFDHYHEGLSGGHMG